MFDIIKRSFVLVFVLALLCACSSPQAQSNGSQQSESQSGASTEASNAAGPKHIDFEQGTLPVMRINVNEDTGPTIEQMHASPNHSVECTGTADLVVADKTSFGYGASQESLTNMELEYIRGRGHSTWVAPKKAYKLKFKDKQGFFGMEKSKHWVLLANAYDSSLVRNRLVNWLARRMDMDCVMQDVPVDLVMNGEYLGSYVLCEHVRIGKGRVDIDELTAQDTDPQVITGGYLISLFPDDDEPKESIFTTSRYTDVLFENPSFCPVNGGEEDYANDAQRDYICSYLQRTEDAIFGAGDAPYTSYIDARSFADAWLLQAFTCNGDAFTSTSNYLYKERGGKLVWGPLWDFDLSFNLEHRKALDEECLYVPRMHWLDKLREDKEYHALLVERWKKLDAALEEVVRPGGVLDSYRDEMSASWGNDCAVWGDAYETSIFGDHLSSYEKEIEDLREWIEQRRPWMAEQVGKTGVFYHPQP